MAPPAVQARNRAARATIHGVLILSLLTRRVVRQEDRVNASSGTAADPLKATARRPNLRGHTPTARPSSRLSLGINCRSVLGLRHATTALRSKGPSGGSQAS